MKTIKYAVKLVSSYFDVIALKQVDDQKNNINSSYNSSLCWLIFNVHSIKVRKKIPIIKLSILSLIFTILVLGYFRYSSHFPPDTTYSPPKFENGKLVPAENK